MKSKQKKTPEASTDRLDPGVEAPATSPQPDDLEVEAPLPDTPELAVAPPDLALADTAPAMPKVPEVVLERDDADTEVEHVNVLEGAEVGEQMEMIEETEVGMHVRMASPEDDEVSIDPDLDFPDEEDLAPDLGVFDTVQDRILESERFEELRASAGSGLDRVTAFAQENPVKALVAAFAAGYLTSKVIGALT